jgi:hypothetical protein
MNPSTFTLDAGLRSSTRYRAYPLSAQTWRLDPMNGQHVRHIHGSAALGRNGLTSATCAASYVFAAVVLGFLLAMLVLFAWQSLPVWRHEGTGYLTGTRWFYRGEEFVAASMIYGTAAISAIGLGLAAPLGPRRRRLHRRVSD